MEQGNISVQERYSWIFDHLFEGAQVIDFNHNYLYVNDTAVKYSKYKREELLGHSQTELYPGIENTTVFQKIKTTLLKRIAHYDENEFTYPDGSTGWFDIRIEPVPEGVLILSQDITGWKQTQFKLQEEKERLAVTLRSIGDGVITTDISGKITMLNGVAEQLTGWSSEDALGKPLSEIFNIVSEKSRCKCENPLEKVLKAGTAIELTNHTLLISRDGREIILADSGAPIRDNSGNIIGVIIVFRDITEKQKLIESAQRTDKLEAIGILASGIAHDFNNLLGGIYGYIDNAKMYCEPESKALININKALDTFSKARHLTQQLLTFSKGGSPERKTASLEPVLKQRTLYTLKDSSIKVIFSIQDDLWFCDFDEYQIGQVIENIVTNALQAMPQDGTLTVTASNKQLNDTLGALSKGNYVSCTFTDTGTGIPENIISRIFDPFFTTKQKSSGLGLSTAYSIIRKHDGDIMVKSEIDKGTSVHLFIPASSSNAAPVSSQKPPEATHHNKVIVMDDEVFIREILGDMLKAMGYEVEFALNGHDVLRKLQQYKKPSDYYSAIIMDLTIPGAMGGKETIIKVRELDPDIPAFVSSGYADDPVMAEPKRFGFTDKIQKPFRKKELQELFTRNMYKT